MYLKELRKKFLNEWVESLDKDKNLLDTNNLSTYAKALEGDRPFRDAVIAATVGYHMLTKRNMNTFANNPHGETAKQHMYKVLDAALYDPDYEFDATRFDRAYQLVNQLMQENEDNAQPYGMLAFLKFIAGNVMEAVDYADKALDHDGNCTIAATVLVVLGKKIKPAWTQAK
ncbi:hypothetical protein [Bifidobacterium callitrichidarum]|uniref:Uncharacterized protein n=1 Tax=Bifidobacterium callitrichidarum TaxID=2052941 RepID=A0A2U2NC65_9BIFI|nr:hypothetical protein [Bifidobacterium callitrichidarum]PWG66624.1 hypothetical protein DF196_01610 [Bifidobacterium callitrichidarum]